MNDPWYIDSEKKAMEVAKKWYREQFRWERFTGDDGDFRKLAQLLLTTSKEAAMAEREHAIIVINEKGDRVLLGWLPPRFEVQTLPSEEKSK